MTGLNDVVDWSDLVSLPIARQSRQGVGKYPIAVLTNGVDARQSNGLDVFAGPSVDENNVLTTYSSVAPGRAGSMERTVAGNP